MARILQAVQPDVIGMSEVEDFSADFVRELLDTWMPLDLRLVACGQRRLGPHRGQPLAHCSGLSRSLPAVSRRD